MKLQFKHQKFPRPTLQKLSATWFAGQPFLTPTYMMDKGLRSKERSSFAIDEEARYNRLEQPAPCAGAERQHYFGKHIQQIQRNQQIKPSEKTGGAAST
jgi:type III restriction enzyme